MFKEVLQIVPKLSQGDLNQMERSLSSRFSNVAKKFGKGLISSIAGGGIAGAALGLIDKLLNPLKETQEAIDRLLKQGDDVVTNAKQFGTTAGKFFRLQQLAKSTGLDEQTLGMMMARFQTALAEAQADPNKSTSVRQYTGQKDIAEAFFNFIQSLQRLPKNQQVLVQQEVFGEKAIMKMADFLQTDFAKQARLVGGPSATQLNPGLEKIGELNDLKDALEARRTLNDTFKKSKIVNEGMVRAQDLAEKRRLERENAEIKSYNDLAMISDAATEITNMGRQIILSITSMLVKLTDLADNVRKLSNSKAVRGIMKFFGSDK
jgi:uncharacterized protein YidB (DUF937 family)